MSPQTTNMLDTDLHIPAMNVPVPGRVSIVTQPDLETLPTELLVCAVRATESKPWTLPSRLLEYDATLGGALADVASDGEFKGQAGKTTDIIRVSGASARRIVLYGLGDASKCGKYIAKAAALAVEKGRGISAATSVALYIDGARDIGDVSHIAESACIAAYVDERFKGKPSSECDDEKKPPSELVLVGENLRIEQADVVRGQTIAAAVIAAKELINSPANCLTPERLAEAARTIAKEADLEIVVHGREELLRQKMGCYLAVTQGSLREPQLIHLTYRPNGTPNKKIALVGKAICFDSGGYNIKTSAGIATMKIDMSGAAAVILTAYVVGRLRPEDVEVHFVAPACENMVSEKAIHPGDIVAASNGKTVELMNTDAEGRLCLADALVYAEKIGQMDAIVDIATLTGSIGAALGSDISGFFARGDDIATRLEKAGKETNEPCWRMPLVKSYSSKLKSKTADLRNISTTRGGGAITAALFLAEFVKNENWAHIDMAGVATNSDGLPSGYGVKTLFHVVESFK